MTSSSPTVLVLGNWRNVFIHYCVSAMNVDFLPSGIHAIAPYLYMCVCNLHCTLCQVTTFDVAADLPFHPEVFIYAPFQTIFIHDLTNSKCRPVCYIAAMDKEPCLSRLIDIKITGIIRMQIPY